jgi:hypothetical protein
MKKSSWWIYHEPVQSNSHFCGVMEKRVKSKIGQNEISASDNSLHCQDKIILKLYL